ncbi:hypothetical protein [Patulibacter minatonensis]|uniref:hypothetical protein n=1 Tax=Patulibacter minatonensis TaxID=298163 RepID=UPI00047A4EA4|nr:hypothetical protein [Patulibacter minatonensis]
MAPFFLFVQFEFTHGVGPGAGRYVVVPERRLSPSLSSTGAPGEEPLVIGDRDRVTGTVLDAGAADVLVMAVQGVAKGRRRIRRKARLLEPEDGLDDVPIQLASYVEASAPIPKADEARDRLEEIAQMVDLQQRWVDEGLAVLNRAIRGHRAGSGDPYRLEVARRDARKVRIGFGTSSEVAEGGWTDALDIPAPPGQRASRASTLAPAEAVADALTGRLAVLECEDLLIRVFLDLDAGRTSAAALQAAAGLRLVRAEVGADDDRVGDAVTTAAELAETGLQRALNEGEVERLMRAVEAGTRILETRRHAFHR